MPSIFAPQTPVANDNGAVTLSFQGAPNVLYDRTMVGDTTYTISTAGTSGGETMSLTLRGPHQYSFASSVAMSWSSGGAPAPSSSMIAFDRIKFEVLQDGTLLGTVQAVSAFSPPAHYLIEAPTSNIDAPTSNSYSYPVNTANDVTDGYLDIQARVSLNTLAHQQIIFSKWNFPGNNFSSGASFLFYLNAAGFLSVEWYDTAVQTATSTVALSTLYSPNAVTWLRVQLNATTSPITGEGSGSAVSIIPPGSAVFSISVDSVNWLQIGTTVAGGATAGIAAGPQGIPVCGSNDSTNIMTGRFYTLRMYSASGALRYSPDFTTLSTGQTGAFTDNAASPNIWTISGNVI